MQSYKLQDYKQLITAEEERATSASTLPGMTMYDTTIQHSLVVK